MLMRGFGGGVSENCSGEERTVLNNSSTPILLFYLLNYLPLFFYERPPSNPYVSRVSKTFYCFFFHTPYSYLVFKPIF